MLSLHGVLLIILLYESPLFSLTERRLSTGSPADGMRCSVSAAGGWVVYLVVAAGMDGVRLGFWANTVVNNRAHEKSTTIYLFIEYGLRNIYCLCLNVNSCYHETLLQLR